MKKKKMLRLIKREAKRVLPPETYFYVAKYDRPRQDESGQWKVGEVAQNSVNHGRRLKKIFNKWGLQAVQAYFYVKLETKRKNEEKNSGDSVPQESTGTLPEGMD